MKPLTHGSPGLHRMPLLEREPYLADLARWLEAGSGRIALVSGEAGIGKTALLQEFCHRERSVRVLWGACDALFTPRPLAPLHDIARQTKGALLQSIDSGESRDRIFTAALDELESGPASLVVFEDVHWADEATLDLLKFLGRRTQRTRATLALTYRDDEVGVGHPLRFVLGEFPRPVVHRAPCHLCLNRSYTPKCFTFSPDDPVSRRRAWRTTMATHTTAQMRSRGSRRTRSGKACKEEDAVRPMAGSGENVRCQRMSLVGRERAFMLRDSRASPKRIPAQTSTRGAP